MSIYLHIQFGDTPLKIASHSDIVSLLTTYGATPDVDNVSNRLLSKYIDIVSLLILCSFVILDQYSQ